VAPLTSGAEPGDAALYSLRLGMKASSERIFPPADLDEYGDLVGDRNPIFRDDGAARARGFEGRVGPGRCSPGCSPACSALACRGAAPAG